MSDKVRVSSDNCIGFVLCILLIVASCSPQTIGEVGGKIVKSYHAEIESVEIEPNKPDTGEE